MGKGHHSSSGSNRWSEGTRDELGVEALTARAELEGNATKVEAKVSCLSALPLSFL